LSYNIEGGYQARNKNEIRDELIQNVEKEIEKLRRKKYQLVI